MVKQYYWPGSEPLQKIPKHKKRGRKLTTGNYSTRAKLVDRVLFLISNRGMTTDQIARSVGVSPGVIDQIAISKS